MELICTKCDGLGEERRTVTHPAQNVYGWYRLQGNVWYRQCERCNGTGYVPSGQSVPVVPAIERRFPP